MRGGYPTRARDSVNERSLARIVVRTQAFAPWSFERLTLQAAFALDHELPTLLDTKPVGPTVARKVDHPGHDQAAAFRSIGFSRTGHVGR